MITVNINKKAGKILVTKDKLCDDDIKVVPVNESITITPSKEEQKFEPSSNVSGIGRVTCNPIPNSYVVPHGSLIIKEDGWYDVTNLSKVYVSISGEYHYTVKVGQSFTYHHDGPHIYFNYDKDGILDREYQDEDEYGSSVFTGLTDGTVTVTVYDDSDEIIDAFMVEVIPADTKGYTVTLIGGFEDEEMGVAIQYSTNNGSSWTDLKADPLEIPGITQIMFRIIDEMGGIEDTVEWNYNYILDSDTTFSFEVAW